MEGNWERGEIPKPAPDVLDRMSLPSDIAGRGALPVLGSGASGVGADPAGGRRPLRALSLRADLSPQARVGDSVVSPYVTLSRTPGDGCDMMSRSWSRRRTSQDSHWHGLCFVTVPTRQVAGGRGASSEHGGRGPDPAGGMPTPSYAGGCACSSSRARPSRWWARRAMGRRSWTSRRVCDPDVVVTELLLPRLSGLEAARQILAGSAQSRVLVLSARDSRSSVEEALRAGVSGYVTKSAAPEELLQAIDAVAKGESFVSSPLTPPPGGCHRAPPAMARTPRSPA